MTLAGPGCALSSAMTDGAVASSLRTGAVAGAQSPAPEGPGTAEGPGEEPAGQAAWGQGAAGAGAVRSSAILSICRGKVMWVVRTILEHPM